MKIVLVGAGLAAQRCAETLRALGHDGPIAMYGDEPHPPYDRPPLSKAFLKGERPTVQLRPDVWYRDHDVDFRHQRIESLDGLEYDRALIATGATPVALEALPHAHTLRTREDAIALDEALATTRHLAIIGAGLIGQEVASAAVARGVRTTLIDAAERPFDALM
ncbi:FAD-dependent oxidoreductase [Solirubrobacter phytolaccae]|uniref:FAD-dependent oxidoreductase n=1 Tax=Solirubrobacter phytolaccae TaxID=1404360 RepID=A0A9X3N7J2_9ACTN|nr:FAD-dependent oxidoreductase [Solirubrobacter phytolaccae]MDA0179722.1 FAD-dependent oxidoreductase [Solirubrobacter phytolaccae]